jgi:F420H(2)-dependent quinone reductase
MPASPVKQRVVRQLEKLVVNPVMLAWNLGIAPAGDALTETIGRRTGKPRRTPVCDGQQGETLWLVTRHGRRSDYVRNIEANPRVKVRTWRTDWRSGTGSDSGR